MKQLHEYETPETSRLLILILDEDGYLDQRNAPEKWVKFARDIERRLALCRDVLAEISWKSNCQFAAEIAENALAITSPKQ